MKYNLSGIYRTHWEWHRKLYESIAIIFHYSSNAIIGLEICADTNKECGGIYFLNGVINNKSKTIKGEWWKIGNSQCGGFYIKINHTYNQWQGKYNNHLKSTTKYPYTFSYLREL